MVMVLDAISRGLGLDSRGTDHMYKPWSNLELIPPCNNGYQVDRKLVMCEWLQQQKMRFLLQRDETERMGSNPWIR